jgi:hypothetical protein
VSLRSRRAEEKKEKATGGLGRGTGLRSAERVAILYLERTLLIPTDTQL